MLSAIIAEYNPLHKGHQYHIAKTKEKTQQKVLVLMSGNFVQRGAPAIFDKWARAQMALEAGADVVIELPTLFATASAEGFAFGAISILNTLQVVNHLSFGMESLSLAPLQALASFFAEEPPAYKTILQQTLATGVSYPVARRNAASIFFDDSIIALLDMPNNILAIEYLKALALTKSKIQPLGILRKGHSYHDKQHISDSFVSATAIRDAIKENKKGWQSQLPNTNLALPAPVFKEDTFAHLLYLLRTLANNELQQYRDVQEGLENRLLEAGKTARSYAELVELCKSKRYTQTRIERIFTNILLGITKLKADTIQAEPFYAHVLGIKKESLDLLSLLDQHTSIPIITNASQVASEGVLLDVSASDIYALLKTPPEDARHDYTRKLLIL